MENTGLIQEVRFQTNRSAEDIQGDVAAMDGVRSVDCDPDTKTVTVRFDPTIVDENLIKQAVGGNSDNAGLVDDRMGAHGQPLAGIDAAYGPSERGATTQGQPPTTEV